jgi:hypothetical protein
MCDSCLADPSPENPLREGSQQRDGASGIWQQFQVLLKFPRGLFHKNRRLFAAIEPLQGVSTGPSR